MTLTNENVLALVSRQFGEAVQSEGEPYGMLTLVTSKDAIVQLIDWLKNNDTLQINFLTDLCAVHFPEQPGKELAVVYHLHSFVNNFRIRIKVYIPSDNPEIPSMTKLYDSANWMERETYDFFGVQFSGHPNLKRILNVDHMDVFPLLKQYPLEDTTRTDKDDRFFGR